MSGHHHAGDKSAAFTGLIAGTIVLLVVLTAIVKLTNDHYASEKPAAASSK